MTAVAGKPAGAPPVQGAAPAGRTRGRNGRHGLRGRLGRRSATRASLSTRVGLNLAALAVFFLSVFPVYWMVLTALSPTTRINSGNENGRPSLVPWPLTFEHFDKAIRQTNLTDYLWNSLLVSGSTVLASMVVAFLAATAVARFRFRGRAFYLVVLMVVQMIPLEALIIPMYLSLRDADALDKLPSLIAIYLAFVLPFSIWTLRSFVQGIPVDLEEAAMIDGCTRWGAFWRVLFPLVAPGLVATSIFAFVQAWNEYIFCLTLMQQGHYTLPVWLGSFTGREGTDWGGVMAGSSVFTIPVIIFFVLIQRKLTSGLASGAVKG